MSFGAIQFETFKSPPKNIDPPLAINTTSGLYLFIKKGEYDGFYMTTDEVSYSNKFIIDIKFISNCINNTIYTKDSDENITNVGYRGTTVNFSVLPTLFFFPLVNLTNNSFYFVPVNIFNNKYSLGAPKLVNVTNILPGPAYYLKYIDGSIIVTTNGNLELSGFAFKTPDAQNYLQYSFIDESIGVYTAESWPNIPVVQFNSGEFNVDDVLYVNDVRNIAPADMTKYYPYYVVFDSIQSANTNYNRNTFSYISTPDIAGSIAYRYLDTVTNKIVFNQPNPVVNGTTLYYIWYYLDTRVGPNYLKYTKTFISAPQLISASGELTIYPRISNDNYLLISNSTELTKFVGTTINIPASSSIVGYATTKNIQNSRNLSTLYAIPYAIKRIDDVNLVTFSSNYITLSRNNSLIPGYNGTASFTDIGFNRATLVLRNFDYKINGVDSILTVDDIIYIYTSNYENPVATYKLTQNGQQTISIPITGLTKLTNYSFNLIVKDNSTFVSKTLTLPQFTTLNWLIIPSNALSLSIPSRGKLSITIDPTLVRFEDLSLNTSKTLRVSVFGKQYNMIYANNVYNVIINVRGNTIYNRFIFDYNYNSTYYSNAVELSKSITTTLSFDDLIFGNVSVSFSKYITTFTISGFDYLDSTDLSLPTTYGGIVSVVDGASNVLATKQIYPNSYPSDIKILTANLVFDTTYSGLKIKYDRGSKTLSVPTFTVPKQFEIVSTTYPIINKLRIDIDPNSKSFGEVFQYPIKLIVGDITTAEISYPSSGFYTITLDVYPSSTYTIKLMYKYDGSAYTDPYTISTVTTLPDVFNSNTNINITVDPFTQQTSATLSLTNITYNSTSLTSGKIYKSDNTNYTLTQNSLTFPTLVNPDNTIIYRYSVKLRPQISITTGIEDYTKSINFKPFRAIRGLAYTIESLVTQESYVTLIIKDILLDGSGIEDNTPIFIYGVDPPDKISSSTTLSQRATFQFMLPSPTDFLRPAFVVNLDPGVPIYSGQDYLPTIYSPVNATISTEIETSDAYAVFDYNSLEWKFGKFIKTGSYDQENGTYVDGTITETTPPLNFNINKLSFGFPHSKTVYGQYYTGSRNFTTGNVTIYPILINGEWLWGTFAEIDTKFISVVYPVGTNMNDPKNPISGDGPLPPTPPMNANILYINKNYYANGLPITTINISNLKVAGYIPEDGSRLKVLNRNGTDITGYTPLNNDPDGLITNFNSYDGGGIPVYSLVNGNCKIPVPINIENHGDYKLVVEVIKFGTFSDKVFTHNGQDIPQTGYVSKPSSFPITEIPNALRTSSSSINLLKYPDQSPYFYVSSTNNSYNSEIYDISAFNLYSNIKNRLSILYDRTVRTFSINNIFRNDLYIIPVNKNQKWASFGSHTLINVGEFRLDAPGYLLSNLNIPNTTNEFLSLSNASKFLQSGRSSLLVHTYNSILDTTSDHPSFYLNRSIRLERISSKIIHNVTRIDVGVLEEHDILYVYTTTVKEFPYRPIYDRTIKTRYIKESGRISFVDPLFQSRYTKFYGFATKEQANTYANTLAINPTVSNAIISDTNLNISGTIPSTIYVVPYSTTSYNSETLVSYINSPIILLSTDNMLTLTGIKISNQDAIRTSKISSCVVNITYTRGDQCDIYGMNTTSTIGGTNTLPLDSFANDCTINIISNASSGKTRGVYNTGNLKLKLSNMNINSSGGSDSAGIETTNVNSFIQINNSSISGINNTISYDIIQPDSVSSPVLQLYSTILKNGTASNGFGSMYQNSYLSFMITGNITSGITHYLSPGTQVGSSLSTSKINIPFLNRTIIISAFIKSSSPLSGSDTATVNFYKNSETTPFNTLTIDATGTSTQYARNQAISTVFNSIQDVLVVELDDSTSINNNSLFISLETY